MTTATIALPPVTPDFQRAFRALGCAIGWKNAAKQVAYGPVRAITHGVEAKPRRNGRNKEYTLAWYDEGGRLHQHTYHTDRNNTAWGYAREYAHELDATRYQRPIPAPFTPARRITTKVLDKTDARLALYKGAKCCGQPMGVIEAWEDGVAPLYQCAVNAKHTKPAVLKGSRRKVRGA